MAILDIAQRASELRARCVSSGGDDLCSGFEFAGGEHRGEVEADQIVEVPVTTEDAYREHTLTQYLATRDQGISVSLSFHTHTDTHTQRRGGRGEAQVSRLCVHSV